LLNVMADYDITVTVPNQGPPGPQGPAGAPAPTPIVKWKTATQSVTNSTTLVDDDTLFFETEPNARYFVRLFLMVEGQAGIANTHSFIIDATNATVNGTWRATGGTFLTTPLTTQLNFSLAGSAPRSYYVFFTVEGGASAGEVKLRWAQGAVTTTTSSINEGSVLIAEKLP
jgi:hypothetical protein